MKNNSYDSNFQEFMQMEEVCYHLSLCLYPYLGMGFIFIGNMGEVIELFNSKVEEILNVKI